MIKKLIENYLKAAHDLKDFTGLLGRDLSSLQCSTEGFLRLLEQYNLKPIVSKRRSDSDLFPYEATVKIEGYNFFTILTTGEYERFFKEMIA